MNILLATESYWPNHDGGAVFEHNLVLDLVKKGHNIHVIAPSATFKNHIEQDNGSTVHRVASVPLIVNTNYRISFWPFRKISNSIDEYKPDIVHIHNTAFIGLAALFAARKRGIPIIATNHFMPENALTLGKHLWLQRFLDNTIGKLAWKYLIWFHNQADFVTSPTSTAVDLLVAHGLKKPHRAISNGVDINRFKPAASEQEKVSHRRHFNLPEKKPVVLYAGRLDPEKRLDILINAVPLIIKEVDAHIVLAGYGKEFFHLNAQAARLGVKEHVTFLGRVPDEHWLKVYQLADMFAISSPAELQSVVTLEALASGLPVVATRVAALPEIVHDGENGYLFEHNDSAGMAAQLIKLLKDPGTRERFGKKSVELSKPHETALVFKQFEHLYKEIIESSS